MNHPPWLQKHLILDSTRTIHPDGTVRVSMLVAKPQMVAKLLQGQSVADPHAGAAALRGTALHNLILAEAPHPELWLRILVAPGVYLMGHCDSYERETKTLCDLKTNNGSEGINGIDNDRREKFCRQLMLYAHMLIHGEVYVAEQDGTFYQVADNHPDGKWVPSNVVFPEGVEKVHIHWMDESGIYPNAITWEAPMLEPLRAAVWNWAQETVVDMMAGVWKQPSEPARVPKAELIAESNDVLLKRYTELAPLVEEFDAIKDAVRAKLAEGQKLAHSGWTFSKSKPTMKSVLGEDWQKRLPKPVESYQITRTYTALDMDAVQADLANDKNAWQQVPASTPRLTAKPPKGSS